MKQHNDTIKEFLIWGAVFLGIVFGAKHYHGTNDSTERASVDQSYVPIEKKNTLELVNENLKDADLHYRGSKQNIKVGNEHLSKEVSPGNLEDVETIRAHRNDYNFRVQPKNAAEEVFKNINPEVVSGQKTVEDEIISEAKVQEWLDAYDQQNKKKYIEALMRVARQKGFEIKMDQNFKIKSVRRIRLKKRVQY